MLKPENFKQNMTSSFPAVSVTDEDVCATHDFILTMLRWNPKRRPIVSNIFEHSFLSTKIFQNKMSLKEDCNNNEIKIAKSLLEECLDESEGNPISLVYCKKSVKRDSKHYDFG